MKFEEDDGDGNAWGDDDDMRLSRSEGDGVMVVAGRG